jgi:Fe2+ transport system protein FeoA
MTATCPLCGVTFDPLQHSACGACPIGAGCRMTCCPACGYSWIDPAQTRTGRFLERWFGPKGTRSVRLDRAGTMTLAEVPAGWRARLADWEATPPQRRQQLRAYGLSESSWMHVLQHTPTTIIRVERTELALERELAETILVDEAQPLRSTIDPAAAST